MHHKSNISIYIIPIKTDVPGRYPSQSHGFLYNLTLYCITLKTKVLQPGAWRYGSKQPNNCVHVFHSFNPQVTVYFVKGYNSWIERKQTLDGAILSPSNTNYNLVIYQYYLDQSLAEGGEDQGKIKST